MAEKQTIYLKDYRPPDFLIDFVTLDFLLGERATRVRSELSCRRNGGHTRPLVLDGEDLKLIDITVDGAPLADEAYSVSDDKLALYSVSDNFVVHIEVEIYPQDNTTLSGLYRSSGNFCTQCEAEGFRRITYFLDRPDVLTRYTTIISADKEKYPELLSNGNLVERRDIDSGRHRVVWEDPFPKPSYLFALVAGNLAHIRDSFVTRSGRPVDLYIYTQHHNIDKCDHAMASLQKAMTWDEDVYGREYDLDRYMIVAVDDFNMGAMENKGLNIFNSKYVLAKPETATDADYDAIEGVIAHEYFHNWSGNRVTCRDWFQLSLKEGFTVFRDQEFSADMGSRGVNRIRDVNVIRVHQFLEDSGPMAHPVRPQSYQEINNFYTVTVYNKGAEVVRMLRRLVGPEGFRRGTDHYFERFDGQAVTTDDFVKAMEERNEIDLGQFTRWYDQAGTPRLELVQHYDVASKTFALDIHQSCPPTGGGGRKKPFHIPLAIALLNADGEHMALDENGAKTKVLEVKKPRENFVFQNIPARPVLSALREFSAPCRIDIDYTDDDLYFLMVNDTDPFARWEAVQRITTDLILDLVRMRETGAQAQLDNRFIDAFKALLLSGEGDCALLAELLKLPSETYISEFLETIDPEAVFQARSEVKRHIAQTLWSSLLSVYNEYQEGGYKVTTHSMGRRSLKNTCLDYLLSIDTEAGRRLALEQYRTADNMTDKIAALWAINDSSSADRESVLADFQAEWRHESLVIDKWLGLEATSRLPGTLGRVKQLIDHDVFNLHNPNRVRALIGSFAHSNALRFHERSGEGYRFVADHVIELDKLNPQVASRLATSFNRWRRYDQHRQKLIETELTRIANVSHLSGDVREIVSKALGQAEQK